MINAFEQLMIYNVNLAFISIGFVLCDLCTLRAWRICNESVLPIRCFLFMLGSVLFDRLYVYFHCTSSYILVNLQM